MTDIIKDVAMLKAGNLMHLTTHPDAVVESVECLLEEFADLSRAAHSHSIWSRRSLPRCQAPPRESVLAACACHALRPTTSRKRLTGTGFSANWLYRLRTRLSDA